MTTNDAVLSHLKKGTKFLECTASGAISFPSTQAYGTWEFDINCPSTSDNLYIGFISTLNNLTNYYAFRIMTTRALQLYRYQTPTITYLLRTSINYIELNKNYRIKITRTPSGVFTCYIKGGNFGKNYQLIVPATESNPATDNNITSSKFMVMSFYQTQKIGNIKFTEGIEI